MSVSFPTIQTKRLLLRQFVDDDLENVFKGLSNPDVIKYYGVSYSSLQATKEQMQFFADLEKNGTGIWWAVCSADNSIFYGAAGLNNLNATHKKAEIGCWLLPEYWGRGIMQEVIPFICDYGFKIRRLHRIEGFVESDNFRCKTRLAQLGFQYEGTMKDCETRNERWISLDMYARLSKSPNQPIN